MKECVFNITSSAPVLLHFVCKVEEGAITYFSYSSFLSPLLFHYLLVARLDTRLRTMAVEDEGRG